MNMPASTPEELRTCIAADAQTSPSTYLADDSFAAWCYDHLSLVEARSALERDADPEECDQKEAYCAGVEGPGRDGYNCTFGDKKNE